MIPLHYESKLYCERCKKITDFDMSYHTNTGEIFHGGICVNCEEFDIEVTEMEDTS